MRGHMLLVGWGVFATVSPLLAQFPPPVSVPQTNPLPQARSMPYSQSYSLPIQIGRLPDPPNPQPPIPPPGSVALPRQASGTSFPSSPGLPGSSFPTSPGALPPGWSLTPTQPSAPRPLPQSVMPQATAQPQPSSPTRIGQSDGSTVPLQVDTPLPYAEAKIPLDPGALMLKRVSGSWQVWVGPKLLKTLGDDEAGAKDVVRVLRELHPTEWVSIGSPRPIVEYGLINGRPAVVGGFPRMVLPIDLRTIRIEPVRGVYCLRDDGNILLNFGIRKPEAEQALAVVRKYGFNRIGMVGSDTSGPIMTYFFVALEADGAPPAAADPFAVVLQENSLGRTGIPVAGVGYIGEMVKIDPRKLDIRRVGADWVVASGNEILARFGPSEWAARDAGRVIYDAQFTEFCRVNAGLSFFLVNGRAPTNVPLSVQGRRYDLATLKTTHLGQRWAVTENGRPLFDVSGAAEGEAVIRLLRYFQFDQLCQVGPNPRSGLMFLAKSR